MNSQPARFADVDSWLRVGATRFVPYSASAVPAVVPAARFDPVLTPLPIRTHYPDRDDGAVDSRGRRLAYSFKVRAQLLFRWRTHASCVLLHAWRRGAYWRDATAACGLASQRSPTARLSVCYCALTCLVLLCSSSGSSAAHVLVSIHVSGSPFCRCLPLFSGR